MKLSYRVYIKGGDVGVADNDAGEQVLRSMYHEYGNLRVWVYDHDDVFGVGYDGAEPMQKTRLKSILMEIGF